MSRHPEDAHDGNDDHTHRCDGVVEGLVAGRACTLLGFTLCIGRRRWQDGPIVGGRRRSIDGLRRQVQGVGGVLQQLRQFDVRYPAPLQDVEVRERRMVPARTRSRSRPLVGGRVTVPLAGEGWRTPASPYCSAASAVRPEVVIPVMHVIPAVDDVGGRGIGGSGSGPRRKRASTCARRSRRGATGVIGLDQLHGRHEVRQFRGPRPDQGGGTFRAGVHGPQEAIPRNAG